MPKATCRYIFVFIVFLGAYLFASIDLSHAETTHNIAIVVSKRIRPYMDVLDGINSGIKKDITQIDTFFLTLSNKTTDQKIQNQLSRGQYDLYVAVGPEATSVVWDLENAPERSKIYTAVLNPDTIIETGDPACGISLRIPVDIQISEISNSFPSLKKIGLIFDPAYNAWFYDAAVNATKDNDLTIVPLTIDSKKQIPKVIKDHWNEIDCIWMIPDKTVISKKIVQYIIKQAIYNKKGAIGYNSFFIRSGAFFSFEFNYKKIGDQTAKKIETYLNEGICTHETPVFQKIINDKMVNKIGLQIEE